VKLDLLSKLIENTYVDKVPPIVRLNRQPMNEAVQQFQNSVFIQLYEQLKDVDSERFRQEEQAWTVKFLNEGAEDAGGPYRESIALMCSDLQSPFLPLFIPCPNSKEGTGENRDKFIPNPECIDPRFLRIYNFIGKVNLNNSIKFN